MIYACYLLKIKLISLDIIKVFILLLKLVLLTESNS